MKKVLFAAVAILLALVLSQTLPSTPDATTAFADPPTFLNPPPGCIQFPVGTIITVEPDGDQYKQYESGLAEHPYIGLGWSEIWAWDDFGHNNLSTPAYGLSGPTPRRYRFFWPSFTIPPGPVGTWQEWTLRADGHWEGPTTSGTWTQSTGP